MMTTFILHAASDERFVYQDDGYVCAWDMWIGNSVRHVFDIRALQLYTFKHANIYFLLILLNCG